MELSDIEKSGPQPLKSLQAAKEIVWQRHAPAKELFKKLSTPWLFRTGTDLVAYRCRKPYALHPSCSPC